MISTDTSSYGLFLYQNETNSKLVRKNSFATFDKIFYIIRSLSGSLLLWLESKRCFSPVFRPYNLSGHGIFQALEISRPWKFPWGTSRFSPWKFPGPGNIHGVGHGNFHGRKCCNFVPWRDSSLQMQNFQLSV